MAEVTDKKVRVRPGFVRLWVDVCEAKGWTESEAIERLTRRAIEADPELAQFRDAGDEAEQPVAPASSGHTDVNGR